MLILITIILYLFNQTFKSKISVELIRWFMCCYFNDMIGGITFTAYCNLVLSFNNKKLVKIWQIELLMFVCGIFWEYVTPLFRKSTVTDNWDIVAYMIGGIFYCIIIRKERNECKRTRGILGFL